METGAPPTKVLLIEDEEEDFRAIRDMLSVIPCQKFQLKWLADCEAALEAIAREPFDVCFLSYSMGRGSGPDMPRRIAQSGRGVPVVVLTGRADRDVEPEVMKAGADDYLPKGELNSRLLERCIRYARERARARDLAREANTALKVLLKQREDDRAELEQSLLENVRRLVAPYLEKLKKSLLAEDQIVCLEMIEGCLKEITSPFARGLSSPILGLTPTEIRVSDLVRQGKRSKEIAEILNSTERAVLFHRQNIRQKLGLKQKKLNLQAYLASLAF